jgi:hypothetical protein
VTRHRLAGLLLVAFAGASLAHAADTLPDWVTQAASARLPAYSSETKAVVLMQDDLVTVQADGKALERHREVIKILRPQGREYAELVAWFSQDRKLNSFHAWSIGPDGHQYTVKDDQVREVGAEGAGLLYVDTRAKVVHPPGADPNGIVACEWQRQLPSYVSESVWDFQESIPILQANFEVDLPANWQHYVAWLRHDPVAPVEATPGHYRWQLANVTAVNLENILLAPSAQALTGRMVVHFSATSLPDGEARWAQIGDWYDGLASPRTEAPGEIASKARELAGNETDFVAKIQKVAQFMQREIRYVGIEIGIGGLQPHPAADIFRNRYGDCKDKATLLIAMLNAVGVRGTWVLVDTHRGFVDPSLPSIDGNHAIAAIEIPKGYSDPRLQAVVTAKSGKRYLIFDPTNEYVSVGLLPTYLQGGYGILVAGKDSQVIQLPKLAPEADIEQRAAKFELTEDGTLKGAVQETRSGASAWHVRSIYQEKGEKDQREYMERQLQKDFSSFTLNSQTASNARDLDKLLVLNYDLTAKSYAKTAGSLLLVRPRVIGTDAFSFEDKPRSYPIDLGRTGTWRDSFDVSLPAGYEVDDLPAPVSVDVGFATYRSEVKSDASALHYTRELVVRELQLPAEKYADLRKLEGAIVADENSSAVLKKK